MAHEVRQLFLPPGPVMIQIHSDRHQCVYALRESKKVLGLKEGDTVVMTGGNTSGESGNTNVIRIETIE